MYHNLPASLLPPTTICSNRFRNATTTRCGTDRCGTTRCGTARQRRSPCKIPNLLYAILLLSLALTLTPAASAQEDPPAASRLATEAGNLQNRGQFDLAAELWADYLKQFPTASFAPKAQYYLGVCQMKLNELPTAISQFQKVVGQRDKSPEFPLYPDALLNLGWCQFSLAERQPEQANELYKQAATNFATLIKDYPESQYADQALFFRAESLYLGGDTAAAIPVYQAMLTGHPESSLRPNALYALAVALDESGQGETARTRYTEFLTDFASHGLAKDVAMRRAENLLQLALQQEQAGKLTVSSWANPQTEFAKLANDPEFEQADRALYQEAFCLSKRDAFEQAAQQYAKLPERFPQSPYKDDARLSAGRSWYQAEQYARGIETLQPLTESESARRFEARHWLAKSLLAANQPDQALKLTTQWLAADDSNLFRAELMMDKADAAFASTTARNEARTAYVALADRFPEHPLASQALYNAAFEDFEAGRAQQALELIERFLAAYADTSFAPDVRALQAESQLLLGQADQAEKVYRELIASVTDHPDAPRWPLRLALTQTTQKKYQDALATLQAVKQWPQPQWAAEANYLAGSCHYYLEQYDDAQAALRRAIRDPGGWNQVDTAMVMLARTQAKQLDWDGARNTLQTLLTQFPETTLKGEVWFRIGEVEEGAQQIPAARDAYQKSLAADPDGPLAPYAQAADAWLAFEQQDWPAAIDAFQSFLARNTDHPLTSEVHLGLGMTQRQSGAFAAAINTLEPLLNNQPQDDRAATRFELAMAHLGLEDYGAAQAQLDQLLNDSANWERLDQALYQRGWVAKYQDQTASSIGFFQQLADKFPNSPLAGEAWFHLGEASYEDDDFTTAADRYQKAITASQPGRIRNLATYKLGWTQFKTKATGDARATFAALQEQATETVKAQAAFMVAECDFETKDYANALTEYQQVLTRLEASQEIAPGMKQLARLHATQSANQLKQSQTALDLANAYLEKYPEASGQAEVWFEIGEANRQQDNDSAARDAYEAAATAGSDPLAARSRCMIGETFFAAKDYDEAIKQFRRVMFGFGDQAPDAVKKWQSFAGFEAARCYHDQIATAQGDTRKQLIASAIEAYQYVIDNHPNDALAQEAKKQTARLKQTN